LQQLDPSSHPAAAEPAASAATLATAAACDAATVPAACHGHPSSIRMVSVATPAIVAAAAGMVCSSPGSKRPKLSLQQAL
jgi:hypothetical protein